VWVPCGDGHDFSRPFLKQLHRNGIVRPHFRLRAHLVRTDAGTSDADVFDFLTERAAGSQVCFLLKRV
jgi:hypothetical protein